MIVSHSTNISMSGSAPHSEKATIDSRSVDQKLGRQVAQDGSAFLRMGRTVLNMQVIRGAHTLELASGAIYNTKATLRFQPGIA